MMEREDSIQPEVSVKKASSQRTDSKPSSHLRKAARLKPRWSSGVEVHRIQEYSNPHKLHHTRTGFLLFSGRQPKVRCVHASE
jgi:hypothetical protein